MTEQRKPFEIFRKSDYRNYSEYDAMPMVDMTPAIVEGLTAFAKAQGEAGSGQQVNMVYSRPGVSLTHVWFKSGYPLPLHAHASDCVYFILAGSVRMGEEQLGPGDGFFVGSDVPYTYETGPEGVEVLEFRTTDDFNIKFMAKNKAAWDKTVAKAEARRQAWETELPPSEAQRV